MKSTRFLFNSLLASLSLFSLGSFASTSDPYIKLSNPKPYELVVREIAEVYNELFNVEITKSGELIKRFENCQGHLLPVPERGSYRIHCRKDKSSLHISGRFESTPRFSAMWVKEDGPSMSFY